MSIERSSTAGTSWAGKTLERFSRRIMVSAVCLSSLVASSVTDPPRSRKFAEHVEKRVEKQCQHDDAQYAAKHQVKGDNAADAGEPGEDVLAKPRTAHDGGDRRDTHEKHRGHTHPGDDDRPRQGQLDPQEPLPGVHAHPLCGLRDRRVNGTQTGDRVAQDRQQPVQDQRYDRRRVAEAEDRDEQAEQRERGDGKERRGDRKRHVCSAFSTEHQHAERDPYYDVEGQRYGDDNGVADGQFDHVVPVEGKVFEETAHLLHLLFLTVRAAVDLAVLRGIADTPQRVGGPAEQGGELIRRLLDLASRVLQPSAKTELGRRDVERGDELSLEVPDRRRRTDQPELELLIPQSIALLPGDGNTLPQLLDVANRARPRLAKLDVREEAAESCFVVVEEKRPP